MKATSLRIKHWRSWLQTKQAQLAESFIVSGRSQQILKQRCSLIDDMLKKIWRESKLSDEFSLIAVGGYGRRELYPYSDIDLLILVSSEAEAQQNTEIESLISLLWDIGLNVGHSVRTVEECLNEATKDATVQTNLLEARLLAGHNSLYQKFTASIQQHIHATTFFAQKIKEQDKRHAKFNDTAYNLEPNIKESPGGLRDLQMILWLAQSQNFGNSWQNLVKHQLLSISEAKQIKKHERYLKNLRIRLHLLADRREDRLLFDFQNELATQLGYKNTPQKRASEQLMQSYYRSAKFISLINEILLKALQENIYVLPAVITPINVRFKAVNHSLETAQPNLLYENPSAIIESFLLLQQHPDLNGMGSSLLRELQGAKKLINATYRHNSHIKGLFIDVLSQKNGVNHSLRRMNRYGILGRYIPAFGKIVGQMQHDLFHVYTVDEHILNVLANLRRFSKPELKHEFPLCSRLFAEFNAPHLLYLAAIFHDIAKGRNGDHSTLGTIDARKFCKLHHLPKHEIDLVAWLVEAHLKMSSTAQKSDLSDPTVIENFAKFVGDSHHLTALYLLTVADIRGTSPIVWNAWKARLLENLFHATQRVLQGNSAFSISNEIDMRQQEAAEKLNRFGLQKKSYEVLWSQFGHQYFMRYESDEIAWHSRLLTPHLNTKTPIVRARLSPNGDGIQTMIYMPDQNDLFARICNFFDRMNCSIVEAKIHTTEHGYALNSFIILDQSGKSVSYSGLLKYIEHELTQKLNPKIMLSQPLQGRISRQVKHMPIHNKISLTHEHKFHKLHIVMNDQPGLLAHIAHVFLDLNVELHNAKINTLGSRAEDSFLISGKQGRTLNNLQIKQLEKRLQSL